MTGRLMLGLRDGLRSVVLPRELNQETRRQALAAGTDPLLSFLFPFSPLRGWGWGDFRNGDSRSGNSADGAISNCRPARYETTSRGQGRGWLSAPVTVMVVVVVMVMVVVCRGEMKSAKPY